MTLATHIIIAAAITKPLAPYHPVFTFAVAMLSHYLSDIVPHWDYAIKSFNKNGAAENHDTPRWSFRSLSFRQDLLRFSIDGFLGTGILYALLRPQSLEAFLLFITTIVGSTLPDFLQGLYFTRYFEFLKPIQRFHDLMHTKIKLGPYPRIGVPFQIIIFLLAMYALL